MQPQTTHWQASHLNRRLTPTALAAARALRQRWGWALLAGLTLAVLLAGLLQVLRTAVLQGDALRATTRQQGEAYWHCNTLGTAAERHACRHLSLQPHPAPQPAPATIAPRLVL